MKLEQRKLKTITEETQAIANERMQLENANRKYEKKLKELRNVHKQVCKIWMCTRIEFELKKIQV